MYACVLPKEDSKFPNLHASSAMYPHWLRHRRSRSAPFDQISTHRGLRTCSQSHRMIYHHHVRQGLALSRTLLRDSMASPPPSVTVMIRPAADETTTRDGRPLAQAGTPYVADGDRIRMRGEELAVAAPARPSGRDGVMASPPPPRRRWLLEGAAELPFSTC